MWMFTFEKKHKWNVALKHHSTTKAINTKSIPYDEMLLCVDDSPHGSNYYLFVFMILKHILFVWFTVYAFRFMFFPSIWFHSVIYSPASLSLFFCFPLQWEMTHFVVLFLSLAYLYVYLSSYQQFIYVIPNYFMCPTFICFLFCYTYVICRLWGGV